MWSNMRTNTQARMALILALQKSTRVPPAVTKLG